MHRTFEELGVAIDGVGYGHFTGEVQFDPDGSVALIDIERSSSRARRCASNWTRC